MKCPNGKNRHLRIVGERIIEIDRLRIQQNQINFRMRHPTRFDHVFGRCFFRQRALDNSAAWSGSKEKIKITMEIKSDCEGLHVNS